MRSLVLKFISLFLSITNAFVASFDLDHQASEPLPGLGWIVEPNTDLASEAQQNGANDGLELLTINHPTIMMGDENPESPLFQSGNHLCPNNPNQSPSRRARSKRGEICPPSRDDNSPPVQNSGQAEPEKENSQESAQPSDSPVNQKPLAPYKDRLLCPVPLAPWPVCGTVDSFYIHYQIIYPVTNAPMGWWIHEYCVPAPRFPQVCNKAAREVVWCCAAVFPYLENPAGTVIEPYPALRLIYPNVGYGCVPIEAL